MYGNSLHLNPQVLGSNTIPLMLQIDLLPKEVRPAEYPAESDGGEETKGEAEEEEEGNVLYIKNDNGVEKMINPKDQVDEYGFPKDGYDYSKHLKEMGELRWKGLWSLPSVLLFAA